MQRDAPITVDARIDRLGAQGDGMIVEGDHTLFAPFTLPGEIVRVRAAAGWGELETVLSPSPERVEPPCPHFGACGGCALQHWDRAAYIAWKRAQLRALLARERLEPEVGPMFEVGPGQRRRLALHARRASDGGVRLGFKPRRAWSVVDIDLCVVAEPRLSAALPALRGLAALVVGAPPSAPILHVTATNTGLAVDVTGISRDSGGLSFDARARLCEAAAAADLAEFSLAGEPLFRPRPPRIRFDEAEVILPPGGFLQAAASAEAHMAALAAQALEGCGRAVDLFCGSGAFSLRLARRMAITGYDADEPAIAALLAGRREARGLKPLSAAVRDLHRRPLSAQELAGVEGVVLDPPRAGALAQCREIARSGAQTVVSVSCNPATFVRDAAALCAGGFELRRVTPVDQFLWSPHMELVGVFSR